MHFISKPKHLLAGAITFLYCFLILPITERMAFTLPQDRKTFIISYALKAIFCIFFYFSTYFAINFISMLRAKDRRYVVWLKCSAIYLAIMLVFLALVYPGNWLWDEFIVLHEVKHYTLFSWQNYFTNIFYTICLYLFPSGISIVIFQLVFASLVVGYVIGRTQTLLRNKKLAYWLFVPFLLVPVIYYNLYPLRMTMYSYIEIIMIFKLILLHLRPGEFHHKYQELLYLTILITLLSFWRSEGIYYLLLLPYIVYKLKIFGVRQYRHITAYAWVTLSVVIIALGAGITKVTSDPLYQISATLNPLSTMIQEDLKGERVKESLQSIDKAVRLDILRENPDYREVQTLWKGGVRPDFKSHADEYNKAAIYIILHNPGPYFENRIKTFMATNSFDINIPQVHNGGIFFFVPSTVISRFLETNHFVTPINPDLKMKMTKLFLAIDAHNRNTIFAHIIWNVIPIIVLLVIAAIWKLVRKSYFWVFLIALVLARTIPLFLTSPAAYFMYYLPVYMSGSLLLTLMALFYFDSNKRTSNTKS